mgnify:CR=1 FL=1
MATAVIVSAAVSTVSEWREIFFSVESNRKCFQNKSDVNNHRLKTEFLPSMLILQKCKNNYTSNKFIFWSIFDVFWVRSLSTVFADSKKLKKQNKMGKRLGPLYAMLQWDLCWVMTQLLLSKVPNYLSVKCCIPYLCVQQPLSLRGHDHLFLCFKFSIYCLFFTLVKRSANYLFKQNSDR